MGKWLDGIGIGLSSLCLAHCLLLPLAIVAIPAISVGILASEWVHWLLLALALPISLYAFWRGRRHHQQWQPGAFGLTGLALMLCAVALPVGEIMETVLTVIGAILLATGHVVNQRSLTAAS